MARPKKDEQINEVVSTPLVETTEQPKAKTKGFELFDNDIQKVVSFRTFEAARTMIVGNNHRYTANGNENFWNDKLNDAELEAMARNRKNFQLAEAMNKVSELTN